MSKTPTLDMSPAALEALADAISRPQPLCPYDNRSPDSRDPERSPNDKPCPRCGTEEDGPDKCIGADPTNFIRAAATLRRVAVRIDQLQKENFALWAKIREQGDLR